MRRSIRGFSKRFVHLSWACAYMFYILSLGMLTTTQMILVASPSKPFQFTVKRQPRRHFIVQEYHDEIERLYKEVETSAQSELQPPAEWNQEGTLAFVRAVVTNTLRRKVSDDADIFRSGGDR